eukprot:SAG31_NODE_2552_length_5509_cov_3.954898_1_plen_328_part_00
MAATSLHDIGKASTNPTFDSYRLTVHHHQANLVQHGWFNLSSTQHGHFRPRTRDGPRLQRGRLSSSSISLNSLPPASGNRRRRPSQSQTREGLPSRPASRGSLRDGRPVSRGSTSLAWKGRGRVAVEKPGLERLVRPDPWAPYRVQRRRAKEAERQRQQKAWDTPEVQAWLAEKDILRRLGVGLWSGELSRCHELGDEVRSPLAPAGMLERWQLEQLASSRLGVDLKSSNLTPDGEKLLGENLADQDLPDPGTQDGEVAAREPEPDPDPECEAQPQPEPELEAEAEAEPQPEPEPESQPQPQPQPQPELEAESQPQSQDVMGGSESC